MPTDDERAVQLRRDNADRVAPWAGYGWKVNELLDRVQAAEAEVRRLRAENVDALIEVFELRAAIREHDRRYTLDGGGRARCYPVMGELLPGDDDE